MSSKNVYNYLNATVLNEGRILDENRKKKKSVRIVYGRQGLRLDYLLHKIIKWIKIDVK